MTNDKALEAARAAYRNAEENPRFVECPRCKGVGYHHGFGEDGNDPDWCSQCGGSQQIMTADEADRPLIEAISAYLSALPGEAEVVALVERLNRWRSETVNQWSDEYEPRTSWEKQVSDAMKEWYEASTQVSSALQAIQARAEKAERELETQFNQHVGDLAKARGESEADKHGANFAAPAPPSQEAPMVRLTAVDKEIVLLSIFAGMNGASDVSDSKWSWLNWFCNDEEQTESKDDTFNRCIDKGWLTYSHDSDLDCGTARITPAGRQALEAHHEQ